MGQQTTTTRPMRTTRFGRCLTRDLKNAYGARSRENCKARRARKNTKSFSSEPNSSLKIKRCHRNLKSETRFRSAVLPQNERWHVTEVDMPPLVGLLNRLRARRHRFGHGVWTGRLRNPSKVKPVRTVNSVHYWEDSEGQPPSQVRTHRLHHCGDSRTDHVVREREMRQAQPDLPGRLALAHGNDRSHGSG